jgi:hypothetical protein
MDIPFAALAPLLLLVVAFVAYCLVDLARSGSPQHLPKWAWALIILLSVPLGGVIYLIARREPGR